MDKTTFTVEDDKKTLVAERTFDAPKHKVWQAYSDPEVLAKWWAPKGWETTIKHMNFADGDYWHYGMKCVDEEQGDWFGQTSWGKGVYDSIAPEDSFAYTDMFTDENGEATPGMPVTRTVVNLNEADGKTAVRTVSVYDTPESLAQVLEMGMKEGFSQAWDNLERVLAE